MTMRFFGSSLSAWLMATCAGCMVATFGQETAVALPSEWGRLKIEALSDCKDFEGTYSNLGEWTGGKETYANALMGQAIFSSGFPGLEKGFEVDLNLSQDQKTLFYRILGSGEITGDIAVACSSGSLISTKKSGREYLGDGVERVSLVEKLRFFKSTDGSLVIHVHSRGNYSTLLTKKRLSLVSAWYRFEHLRP